MTGENDDGLTQDTRVADGEGRKALRADLIAPAPKPFSPDGILCRYGNNDVNANNISSYIKYNALSTCSSGL